jgi:hypothetical protein
MKIITCFFLLLASACTKSNVSADAEYTKAITVKYLQEITFTDDLKLKITKIEDSRCPKSVQCPWAGKVGLTILFTLQNVSKEVNVDFSSTSVKNTIEVNGKKYEVEVTEVLPYPESPSNIPINDYQITLRLNKI